MRPTSVETTRFYVGLLRDGVPLEGGSAKRVVLPLISLLRPDLGAATASIWLWFIEVVVGMLDLRAERLARLVAQADVEQVESSRKTFRRNVWFLRRALRRNAGSAHRGASFNLLTLCGHASHIDAAEFARNPAGLTGAQALGGAFALWLAIEAAIDKAARWMMHTLMTMLFGRH
jgi:hypothetical protein